MTQEPVPPLPKSSSNVNGCLIGCLVVFVVGLLGMGLIGFTMYKTFQGVVTAYTDDTPRELPTLVLSDEETTAANEKLAAFRAAIEEGTGDREFSFTGDEVNVMLRSTEAGKVFGDSVYVTIANGEVRGEVSLDLGKFIPLLKGRFANGSATFTVYTQGGRLAVYVESFQVKGEEASEELVSQIRAQNLAQDMAKDPEFQSWMDKIQEIHVENDKLIVTLKPASA